MSTDLLTTREAAAMAGISLSRFSKWHQRGRITPAVQSHRRYVSNLYTRHDVERAIAARGSPLVAPRQGAISCVPADDIRRCECGVPLPPSKRIWFCSPACRSKCIASVLENLP